MNKKVLIVDDEKNIRNTLSAYLSNLNFKLDLASNGDEALKQIQENDYDLILLDIKMHGLTGIQVLREMRKLGKKDKVIMMTAYGTIENAVESMKLGAVDFINKPFTLETLEEAIKNSMGRQNLVESEIKDYKDYVEYGKKCILEKDYLKAKEYLKKAVAENLESGEPQNLLGILYEYEGDIASAAKHYRAALDLEPTYKPAQDNLERVTSFHYMKNNINFDEEPEK